MERRKAFTGIPGSEPGPEDRGKAPSARVRLLRILGGIAVALFVILGVSDQVTSLPALCGSCHEMAPRAESWAKSAHAGVKCVACHEEPQAWYAVPQRVAGRARLLGRDLYSHLAGKYESPIDSRMVGAKPMTDDHCLQCHDPNRKATSGFRIRINHVEHAKRNGSCISCHVRVGHPIATRGTALTLMSQCFTCHGTAKVKEASATCTLCHPQDFELRPVSHQQAKWGKGHGGIAQSDRKQCSMCHKPKFCSDCHGVEMPHPKGWAEGARVSQADMGEAQTGHAQAAQLNRAVCARCHEDKPDLCSMCHHKAWQPVRGPWLQQHFQEVREKGSAYCLKCHNPVTCARCHVEYASR